MGAKEDLISFIESNDIGTSHLYFIESTRKKTLPPYLTYEARLSNDLKNNINSDFFKKIVSLISDSSFVPFNPVGSADNTVECIDVNDVNEYSILTSDVHTGQNILEITKDYSFGNVKCQLYTIAKGDSTIYIFKRYSNYKKLEKGLIMHFINDMYEKVNSNIAVMDDNIDVIMFDGQIYIFSRWAFETIMNYRTNYFSTMEKAVNDIGNSKLIDGFEQFKIDCTDKLIIAKKITHAVNKGNLQKVLQNKKELLYGITYFGLDIKIKNGMVVYEHFDQLPNFVTLLSDGFAETMMKRKIAIDVEGQQLQ